MKKRLELFLVIALSVGMLFVTAAAQSPAPMRQADNPNPPERVVKLIFIHHSTGENWLTDGYGDLGRTLDQNNYFVSDTNYGWGPDAIGDRTDIPNWTEWFAGENTPLYMDALFQESGQNSSYTRTLPDPGGENEIVMFKSCFPNSELGGHPDDPPGDYEDMTVAGAKYVYNTILQYFATRPDKLFVVITAPPRSGVNALLYGANARAFNNWLVNDWLRENNYPLNNVAVFDFYNILTAPDAHHRYNNGQIEHLVGSSNGLYYPSEDDHPSIEGSRKATEEFVPLLNIFYHRWQQNAPLQPPAEAAPPAPGESQPQPPAAPPAASGLLDDLERGPLPGTSGWEGYFQDNTDTSLTCAVSSSLAHSGGHSLQFDFNVTPNSWATCGFYYDSVQNWNAGQGVSFYLRADRAGLPFDVDLYGGSPGGHTTYVYTTETPAESVDGWALVEIPWNEILRAEWEENPGTPFDPAQVTGFSIGLSTPETERLNGTLWLDDLSLLGQSAPAAEPPPAENPPAAEPQPTESAPRRLLPCGGAIALPLGLVALSLLRRKRQE
ncbi:MAG: hypothetical protein Fur0043_05100 [Anaerolineales bacterium]